MKKLRSMIVLASFSVANALFLACNSGGDNSVESSTDVILDNSNLGGDGMVLPQESVDGAVSGDEGYNVADVPSDPAFIDANDPGAGSYVDPGNVDAGPNVDELPPPEEQSLSSSIESEPMSSSSEPSCVSPINNKTLTDKRNGRTYKIVTIGSQTWMAKNLNYETEGSFCLAPADSCAKYGRLYTWAAAIDSVKLASDANNPMDCGYGKLCEFSGKIQGVCPCGWHLPSEAEWEKLMVTAGDRSMAGRTLKAQTDWETGFGDDDYGFTALPAGVRDTSGTIIFVGREAHFWSATADFAYSAKELMLYNHGMIGMAGSSMRYGLSVRCIKD